MSLNHTEIYEGTNPEINNTFMENVNSKLNVHIDIKKGKADTQEWINMMLFSIPYVLKALEKPIKQIVVEEQVVKIELVKKVSIESIKHLAKNTNLITEIDEETNDVKPSKLLESFKEENLLTYENRFLFTLILLMDDFIDYKKKVGILEEPEKNIRKIEYEAKSKVGKERVNIKSEITVDKSEMSGKQEQGETVAEQIRRVLEKIDQLKQTELYRLLSARQVTLVKSPIKMTNVFLKNVNFQYAVKLWNYLNDHLTNEKKVFKEKKDYEDKSLLRNLYNETFLLDYLDFYLIKTKDDEKVFEPVDNKELVRKLTERLVLQILELNPNMTEAQLKELLAENYVKVKSKYFASQKQIQNIFSKNIRDYMDKIRSKGIQKSVKAAK